MYDVPNLDVDVLSLFSLSSFLEAKVVMSRLMGMDWSSYRQHSESNTNVGGNEEGVIEL